jgi:predicted RNA-binding Zn-ribbon protein involved in translation (DUF1610 family)
MTTQALPPSVDQQLADARIASAQAQVRITELEAIVVKERARAVRAERERDALKEQIGETDATCPHCGVRIANLADLHIYSSEGYGELPCPHCGATIGVWEHEETHYHCQPFARPVRRAGGGG